MPVLLQVTLQAARQMTVTLVFAHCFFARTSTKKPPGLRRTTARHCGSCDAFSCRFGATFNVRSVRDAERDSRNALQAPRCKYRSPLRLSVLNPRVRRAKSVCLSSYSQLHSVLNRSFFSTVGFYKKTG
uniref:Putative secreted protein n=1 Tax=Ixodes ricinus TaxID=34613 RepID=A0A6B0UQD2_IXORI